MKHKWNLFSRCKTVLRLQCKCWSSHFGYWLGTHWLTLGISTFCTNKESATVHSAIPLQHYVVCQRQFFKIWAPLRAAAGNVPKLVPPLLKTLLHLLPLDSQNPLLPLPDDDSQVPLLTFQLCLTLTTTTSHIPAHLITLLPAYLSFLCFDRALLQMQIGVLLAGILTVDVLWRGWRGIYHGAPSLQEVQWWDAKVFFLV